MSACCLLCNVLVRAAVVECLCFVDMSIRDETWKHVEGFTHSWEGRGLMLNTFSFSSWVLVFHRFPPLNSDAAVAQIVCVDHLPMGFALILCQ